MRFYILAASEEKAALSSDEPFAPKWCDAWAVDPVNGSFEKCPLCCRPVSMRKWAAPRKMRLGGGEFPDRLIQWLNEPLVVSENFYTAYRESGLTGIKAFHEIEVVSGGKNAGRCPPRYYLAEPAYTQSVFLDLSKTLIRGQKRDWSCAVCNPLGITRDEVERLGLNAEKWDGLDIFRLYTGETICSQRFYDFTEKGRFTNFNLVPIERYSERRV